MRTDIHKPSAITPEDYNFVAIHFDPLAAEEVGGHWLLAENQRIIRQHRKRTGGKFATHEHGGTCMVCGAHASFLACFHHEKTNEYILVGETCTSNLHIGAIDSFRRCRKAVKSARELKAGKAKAIMLLAEKGIERAFEKFESDKLSQVGQIVSTVVKLGRLSDKQAEFIKALLHREDNAKALAETRAKEKALAKDCPEGRIEIKGEVLSKKLVSSQFGDVLKMLVKASDGWTVWGTVPSGLDIERGSQVHIRATVKRAENDPKHGFFSRPKALEN